MSSRFTTSSSAYGSFYAAGFGSLPPRNKVPDPQPLLLTALASPRQTEAHDVSVKCDRCDGPHPTLACPHFRKARDEHEDARAGKALHDGASAGPSAPPTVAGRLVPQPGDGCCLFHSLAYFFGTDATALRRETAAAIEANPTQRVSGTELSKWIEWDQGISAPAYAAKLRSPHAWGGALEIAVICAMMGVVVHVYQPSASPGQFDRIASFGAADESSFTVVANVAYRGRSHYDALLVNGA